MGADTVSSWSPTDGKDLEPNALLAVRELTCHTVVTAGPGAGKTELLAQRANFLFSTGACADPHRVLAISFKIDAARNLGDRVAERCAPDQARRFDSMTFHAFARQLVVRHRSVLGDRVPASFTVGTVRTVSQIHYDDLIPLALEVLRHCEKARRILRQVYAFVFLDEFQDCTRPQLDLIHAAFGDAQTLTTAVGDRKQRIMRFAGALPDGMAEFQRLFSAVSMPIYQNFRSLTRLQMVQNAAVRTIDPDAARDEAYYGDLTDGQGLVGVWRFTDSHVEARVLAKDIESQIASGTPLVEIAVLISRQTSVYGEALMTELNALGIPFRDEHTHQDVLGEPAAEFVLKYLRLLVLPASPNDYQELQKWFQLDCSNDREARSRADSLDRLIQGHSQELASGEVYLGDFKALRQLASTFLRAIPASVFPQMVDVYSDRLVLLNALGDALTVISKAFADSPDRERALESLSATDAVRILTSHKAKGLEFDVVYVVGVETETYWDIRHFEDERANFFVSISRAKEKLVVTHSDYRARPIGFSGKWDEPRRPLTEFLRYAAPYANLPSPLMRPADQK